MLLIGSLLLLQPLLLPLLCSQGATAHRSVGAGAVGFLRRTVIFQTVTAMRDGCVWRSSHDAIEASDSKALGRRLRIDFRSSVDRSLADS